MVLKKKYTHTHYTPNIFNIHKQTTRQKFEIINILMLLKKVSYAFILIKKCSKNNNICEILVYFNL